MRSSLRSPNSSNRRISVRSLLKMAWVVAIYFQTIQFIEAGAPHETAQFVAPLPDSHANTAFDQVVAECKPEEGAANDIDCGHGRELL
jgi:hypothetical protein